MSVVSRCYIAEWRRCGQKSFHGGDWDALMICERSQAIVFLVSEVFLKFLSPGDDFLHEAFALFIAEGGGARLCACEDFVVIDAQLRREKCLFPYCRSVSE